MIGLSDFTCNWFETVFESFCVFIWKVTQSHLYSILKTLGSHELIILILSSGNALCFRCFEYSAAPLALSPVFLLMQIKFSDAKTKTSSSLTSLYFLLMRDFQTKAILVLLFFKFNDAKTKTPGSSTSFALSLLAYLSFPIQCNSNFFSSFTSSLILHSSSRQKNILPCVLFLPLFLIITDFAFFPPAYLLAVSSQLYGLFRGFTKISTLLRIPMPD